VIFLSTESQFKNSYQFRTSRNPLSPEDDFRQLVSEILISDLGIVDFQRHQITEDDLPGLLNSGLSWLELARPR